MKSNAILLFLAIILCQCAISQDLMDLLDKEQRDTIRFTDATFKTTRITFGHSVETRKKGILEIFVSNRFWDSPKLTSQSFAADRMSTRFALEYAISDRLTAGAGGTSWDGLFDAFLKYRLVRQTRGSGGTPVGITLFQNASYYSEGIADPSIRDDFSDRLSFTAQALIASKITRNISLQVAPTFIHKGLSYSAENPANHMAIGWGGRCKLGSHVSFVTEYYSVLNPLKSVDTYGPFALGIDWEIGDVMLQFMLTNAVNMVEDAFIVETRNNFNFRNPNLNFGFNATYVIHFKRALKIGLDN